MGRRTEDPGSATSRGPAALTADERDLGLDRDITRRDFVNAVAVGTGLGLLGACAPGTKAAPAGPHPWTGFGGVGDYASSNGNTWEVVNAGHGIRDGLYRERIAAAADTGEIYDCVIVGGGITGTVAAWRFLKESERRRSCLILDNHPVLGGEAKRNEFEVRGHRLMGPQGSNGMVAMETGDFGELWDDVLLPRSFEFAELPAGRTPMEVPLDNYMYQLWADEFDSHGYFFDEPTPHWVTNPFANGLEGTPWPEEVRRDLLRWRREEPAPPPNGDVEAHRRWLDTMTYDEYLAQRGFHPEVAKFLDPVLAAAIGFGTDTLSAVVGHQIFFPLPGGRKLSGLRSGPFQVFSFPGGNDGLLRAIVKWLNPEAIEGTTSFPDMHNGRIQFERLDRPGIPCRMRGGATVVHLQHDADAARPATVTYSRDARLHSVRARTVIWAAASWSGQHAIANLPDSYREAMTSFPRSPMLVVNVALDNWRFLYELGYSACSWRGGFGFTGNIRAPMIVGDYRQPFDPDQPTVFTLYVPFNQRGLPLVEQGKAAREQLYAMSYREIELQVRRQMTKLFGSAGFDASREIAGIILNRWGHAYVTAGPGFFFGKDGKPSPSDVLRQPHGGLTFAHSELSGHQSSPYSVEEGVRAARQVLAILDRGGRTG
ncbi:MAG: NAD(P)-binding protein [Gemmatimonadales bacterium]